MQVSVLNVVAVSSLGRVRLFMIQETVAYQAPLSRGFSRQEYWSRLSFPSQTRGQTHVYYNGRQILYH